MVKITAQGQAALPAQADPTPVMSVPEQELLDHPALQVRGRLLACVHLCDPCWGPHARKAAAEWQFPPNLLRCCATMGAECAAAQPGGGAQHCHHRRAAQPRWGSAVVALPRRLGAAAAAKQRHALVFVTAEHVGASHFLLLLSTADADIFPGMEQDAVQGVDAMAY